MTTLADLRAILLERGYQKEALTAITAVTPLGRTVDPVRLAEITSAPTSANTAARLFYMARAVPRSDAQTLLEPLGVEPLIAAGLLRAEGDLVRSECAVLPVGDVLICRDFETWATGKPMGPDYVLGVGLATRMLADFTPRRRCGLVLDLGTGQGFQALSASPHAARVIGTDINPRALKLATIALALNGVNNIELREGSFFEPARAECGRFDLIISNPPFVIAPPHDMAAIGGRWEGDRFVQDLLMGIPEHLAEGGDAAVLCNWHHPTPEAWLDRPRSWLEGRGVDAWIVQLKHDDPRTYATNWLRESASVESEEAMIASSGKVDSWLEYYKRIGVGAISMGIVRLRKRTPAPGAPANFVRAETIPYDKHAASGGDQALRVFANEMLLRSAPTPAALLDRRLRVSPDAELHQRSRPEGGRWAPQASILREVRGFEYSVGLDNLTAAVLARLDGARTVRAVVTEMAAGLKADPRIALEQTAPFIAKMLTMTHAQEAA
jgi:methylase of polypeptide subunit release factors